MARARSRHPRTHVCDICHKTFSRSDVVIRHKANIHASYKQDRNNRGGNTRRPCSNCASLKLRCWGDFPCENCRQRGLTCDLKPKNPSAGSNKPDQSKNSDQLAGPIDQISQVLGGSYGRNLSTSLVSRTGERPFSASSDSSYNSPAVLSLDPYHYQFQHNQQTSHPSSSGDVTSEPLSSIGLRDVTNDTTTTDIDHQYYPMFFEPLYNNIYPSGNPENGTDGVQNSHYDRNENEEPAIPNMWHSGNDWLKAINNNNTNNSSDSNEIERPVYTYLS